METNRFAPGEKLGPYQIEGLLGSGGMGQVFRARDTRLGRAVAIKVCSEQFASRFAHEAKAISSLNHPNICTLHDVGPNYLVMELVEGETLASRLTKGPLAAESMLRVTQQIASALAEAHAKGIIHRDLKPGNIMLTKSGVKVLDFGLARFTTPLGSDAETAAAPTISRQLIGTVPYMAPEQLEGKECDARSDIFSMGLVLCEMATGKRVFRGDTQAALIAEVMRCDIPEVESLPRAMRRVIHGCVARDPEDRWQSARDFELALRVSVEHVAPAAAVSSGGKRERWAWAAVTGLLLIALFISLSRTSNVPVEAVKTNYLVSPPPNGAFATPSSPTGDVMTISPQGGALVFTAAVGDQVMLWLRPQDSVSAHVLTGTEGAYSPFWSPDGRWIAFSAGGKLKKVPSSGGAVQEICDAPLAVNGGWGSRGDILFSDNKQMSRVSADGGNVTAVSKPNRPNEMVRSWPSFLPDGRRYLYVSLLKTYRHAVYVGSLDSNSDTGDKFLLEVASRAQYAAPGYLFYVREGTLLAQRFNERDLRLEGEPFRVADHIEYFKETGLAAFSVSADALAYQLPSPPSRLTWHDRQGKETGSVERTAKYLDGMRLSPVDNKLAVPIADPRTGIPEIHILDLLRGTSILFTGGLGAEGEPVWSPDGRTLVFYSTREGPLPRLYRKALDSSGNGDPQLPSLPGSQWPLDWSPEGVLFTSADANGLVTSLLPMRAEEKPMQYLQSPSLYYAVLSPDRRWIAYTSDVMGRPEVYVQSFPTPGEPHRISPSGGYHPRWNRNGRELFYLEGNYYAHAERLMAVPVTLQPSFKSGTPETLFRRGDAPFLDYDVTPDGKAFLMNSGTGFLVAPINVVTNWMAALNQ